MVCVFELVCFNETPDKFLEKRTPGSNQKQEPVLQKVQFGVILTSLRLKPY